MAVFEGSRYQRSVVVRTVDAAGRDARPPFLDLVPPRPVAYQDNQLAEVRSGDQWSTLGAVLLGDAKAWWAVAEWSGVVDPFTELDPGKYVAAPSQTRFHLFVEAGE